MGVFTTHCKRCNYLFQWFSGDPIQICESCKKKLAAKAQALKSPAAVAPQQPAKISVVTAIQQAIKPTPAPTQGISLQAPVVAPVVKNLPPMAQATIAAQQIVQKTPSLSFWKRLANFFKSWFSRL